MNKGRWAWPERASVLAEKGYERTDATNREGLVWFEKKATAALEKKAEPISSEPVTVRNSARAAKQTGKPGRK